MNVLYCWVNLIGNVIYKSYTSLYYLAFFPIPYVPTAIPLVYTNEVFMLVFTDKYMDGEFCR
jgi:hypothetical protein